MTSIGVLLVILGVGSLILPYLGLQFQLMDLVDPYQPWAGIVVAALGLVLILVASRRKSGEVAHAEAETAGATEAAAAAAVAATPPEPPPMASAPPPAAAEPPPDMTPPPPTAEPADTESRAWPTEPPERSDDD